MWANFRLPVWLLISCLKLLRHSLHRNNGDKPVLLLANVRTLFLTSFFTSFFASFVFISFLVLIVKQIFEEKGKFIFIFLQIP